MVRNTLQDLDNHLFEALERLNDEEMSEEKLEKETKRAQAISNVSKTIIQNAEIKLKAVELQQEYFGEGGGELPLRIQ
ncbi:hypothetical protein [Streptococcus sciuri]|uniref:Phage protein n=1 Tax=Streptococcus sciuri TaxID=2973939 RepID=A0ABT2F8U1_9STRE|nr:hypothetical protein [Streptococcus sciuri]MCS4488411.1 hypothetical protein [Streptococcus sciuri]